MEQYLASDGLSILANIVYKNIKDKIIIAIFHNLIQDFFFTN